MYALNTYIDNILKQTNYMNTLDDITWLKEYHMEFDGEDDAERTIYEILEVRPWKYPSSPDVMCKEISEDI